MVVLPLIITITTYVYLNKNSASLRKKAYESDPDATLPPIVLHPLHSHSDHAFLFSDKYLWPPSLVLSPIFEPTTPTSPWTRRLGGLSIIQVGPTELINDCNEP